MSRLSMLKELGEELHECFERYKKIVDSIVESVKNERSRQALKDGRQYVDKLFDVLIRDVRGAIYKEIEDAQTNPD